MSRAARLLELIQIFRRSRRPVTVLGLWLRDDVAPPAVAAPGGSEICFSVATPDAVRSLHRHWSGLDAAIAQPPTEMDFGYTFVALDPDGNRLRVYAPTTP